jgi:putative colanic acid biosynthesis acetyltransferase WcaF
VTIRDEATIGHRVILYALGPITIGARATVSQNAHLCAGTHDHRRRDFALLKQPIVIGEGAWICADAFVGPNVRVGDFAIVGARGVAMRDVAPWAIVAGNPARKVGQRQFDQDAAL